MKYINICTMLKYLDHHYLSYRFSDIRFRLFRAYVRASGQWSSMRKSAQDHINYLSRVGPEKALGYTCYFGMSLKKDWDTRKIEDALHARGLKTKSYKQEEWYGPAHTLCAYHEDTLKTLLENNKGVLERYGWSADPDEFIDNVMHIDAPPKTDLFDLIADAFADYNNWGRTDKKVPEDILKQALQDVRDRPDEYAQPIYD